MSTAAPPAPKDTHTASPRSTATFTPASEIDIRHALGGYIAFLVGAECSDGAWSLTEHLLPARTRGAAPHHHRATTECFYVLEGALTMRLGNESVLASRGSCTVVPPGVTHGFANDADEPVRFIAISSPGGHEEFLRELIALAQREESWPPSDPRELLEIAARHDTYYQPC